MFHICISFFFIYSKLYFVSAGLKIFKEHASKFGRLLLSNYESTYSILVDCSRHNNVKVKHLGWQAIQAFLSIVCWQKFINFWRFHVFLNMFLIFKRLDLFSYQLSSFRNLEYSFKFLMSFISITNFMKSMILDWNNSF